MRTRINFDHAVQLLWRPNVYLFDYVAHVHSESHPLKRTTDLHRRVNKRKNVCETC